MIFVAEIGSAHKGDKSLAFEYIRQSALAGADIAKFQLFGSHPLGSEKGKEFRNAPMEWIDSLAEWCDYHSIELMASIWSMEGLEAARSVGMKRYKIAHQKFSDTPFVHAVLEDGKETFISCNQRGVIVPWSGPPARYIWCSADYPQYPQDLWMPDEFGDPRGYIVNYGYSSHVHGYADALIAIARGAQYIEKHVTLNKMDTSIRDHSFALSFSEFRQMVDVGTEIARLT